MENGGGQPGNEIKPLPYHGSIGIRFHCIAARPTFIHIHLLKGLKTMLT